MRRCNGWYAGHSRCSVLRADGILLAGAYILNVGSCVTGEGCGHTWLRDGVGRLSLGSGKSRRPPAPTGGRPTVANLLTKEARTMSVPRAKRDHPVDCFPRRSEYASGPQWDSRHLPVPPMVPRAGVSAGILGAPVAAWLVTPLLGVMVVGAELTVVLTVVFTALFGSEQLSDRAFRLLRWAWNRSEPPAGTSRRVTNEAVGSGRRH